MQGFHLQPAARLHKSVSEILCRVGFSLYKIIPLREVIAVREASENSPVDYLS